MYLRSAWLARVVSALAIGFVVVILACDTGVDEALTGDSTTLSPDSAGGGGGGGGNARSSRDVVFTVTPISGPAPLTVVAAATTVDGTPLPAGDYAWTFDGQSQAGPVDSHGSVSHVFRNAGNHLVALTVTLAGTVAPLGCINTQSGTLTATAAALPVISGQVLSEDGLGIGGVTMVGAYPGPSVITDAKGAYEIAVPLDWSGNVTPEHRDYKFTPSHVYYPNVVSSIGDQDFHGSVLYAWANHPPVVVNLIADVTVNEDAGDMTISLADVFDDPDIIPHGDSLTLTVSGNANPSMVGATVSGTVLTLDFLEDQNGDAEITIRATDRMDEFAEDTLKVTVDPVNDQPTFTAPGDRMMPLSSPLGVQMTAVSPGPDDESAQTVSFSARSSDQAVIPDGNLVFSGDQLTITPLAAGGPVTITVTAQDDGGTANGGIDLTEQSFEVSVIVGALVSGVVELVETVGARPAMGGLSLSFTGSGAFAGLNAEVETDADGIFNQIVPVGWTGNLSATDPTRLFIFDVNGDEAETWTFGTAPGANAPPVTAHEQLALTVWSAPIGIPGPEFGIKETHYTYAGERFDFNGNGVLEAGEEYPDAGNGPYTHYVDSTHANATDSGNPFGTPSQPRLTIPYNPPLPPGSVVELHGLYDGQHSSPRKIDGDGTPAEPIFVRGPSPSEKPLIFRTWEIMGHYMILENLAFGDEDGILSGGAIGQPVFLSPSHHVAMRNSEVSGNLNSGGAFIGSWNGDTLNNILLYNNWIHHNGDVNASFDQDRHGVTIGQRASAIWLLDNKLHHNSGDGVQINGGNAQSTTHHIYLGRNLAYENKQMGFWSKQAVDVVISQNVSHGHRPSDSSYGAGMGFQYAPERIWFLYNHIYDCEFGIGLEPDFSGLGQDSYFIGNVIHDIHHTGPSYNPLSPYSSAAFRMRGSTNRYIVNNTIYDVDAGINGPGGGRYIIANNIIANITEPQANHIFLEHGSAAANSNVSYTMLHQQGQPVRIRWGSGTIHGLDNFRAAFPSQGTGSWEADPLFVDPANGDFRLRSGSLGIDGGLEHQVYATFLALYGLDIQRGIQQRPRPQGDDFDIGAFEQ